MAPKFVSGGGREGEMVEGGGEGNDCEWMAQRYFLGVKANVVRDYSCFGLHNATGSLTPGDTPRFAGAGGGGARQRMVFLGFQDSDLGQEGVGLVSLRPGDDHQNQGNQSLDQQPLVGDLDQGGGAAGGLKWHRSWSCGGKVTCLEVGGRKEVWAGTARGDVCKIMPPASAIDAAAGGSGEGDQVDAMDTTEEGQGDFRVERVHRGVVASVCCNEAGDALSAGYDGRVFLHRFEPGSAATLHHREGDASGHLTCACWLSGTTFVTGTGLGDGCLQTWDTRTQEPSSSSRLAGLGFLSVSGVPTRPHLCCSGHEGVVCLWDLRSPSAPVSTCGSSPGDQGSADAFGFVWEVKGLAPSPEVGALFCTSAGHTVRWTAGSGGGHGGQVEVVHKEARGIASFDFPSVAGSGPQSLVCVTEEEGLVSCSKQDNIPFF
ncbi:hypothetical protein HOP50_07g50420 [Chloropicon primus]|uniref:WD40 repeat domain-containing protein n=2 Tax=Chloropicon primus TaxID=1764295 RepID=A0A5B8MPR5_9CHLO|nr:hypothetical protein A3770_07p50170 [Chloropicon primus]UPR01720.1 hypothetical protein HOP50_07g50420 [Chloropicon primus]|eukprot:QDZ22499.1 hypothetical protein A3770_07p50170 [Chloropicon primus]